MYLHQLGAEPTALALACDYEVAVAAGWEWYQYREEAMKEFVVAWAEARQIAFVDDVKKQEQP